MSVETAPGFSVTTATMVLSHDPLGRVSFGMFVEVHRWSAGGFRRKKSFAVVTAFERVVAWTAGILYTPALAKRARRCLAALRPR
jgi:hypothetical protein